MAAARPDTCGQRHASRPRPLSSVARATATTTTRTTTLSTPTGTVAGRLSELGLTIPPAQVAPPGVRLTYERIARWGDVAYIAGHGPTHGEGWGSPLGQVGRDVTVAEAVAAAELTALNVLGTIERELGGLDVVARWLKTNGYVNAVDGFTEHARVINGFSDVVVALYGRDRLGARTSVGVPHLPFDMPVEIDAVVALR